MDDTAPDTDVDVTAADAVVRPAPRDRGAAAERAAAAFLVEHGLERLDGNWRRRLGEIDLVMREPDDGTIVFVEVRYRSDAAFGGALESVDRAKRSKLRRSAFAWLQHHADPDDPARIDVVAIGPVASAPAGSDAAERSDGGRADHGRRDGERTAGAPGNDERTGGGRAERVVARRGELLVEWVVSAVEDDE